MKKYLKVMYCFIFLFLVLFITKIDSKASDINWNGDTITWTSSGTKATNSTLWRVTAWDISCTVNGKTYTGRFTPSTDGKGATYKETETVSGNTITKTRSITEKALKAGLKCGNTALTDADLDDTVYLTFNAVISIVEVDSRGNVKKTIASNLGLYDWYDSNGNKKTNVGGYTWRSTPDENEHWNINVRRSADSSGNLYYYLTVNKGTGCASVYNAKNTTSSYSTSNTRKKYTSGTKVYWNGKAANGYHGYASGQEKIYSSNQSQKLTANKRVTLSAIPNTFTLRTKTNAGDNYARIKVNGSTSNVASLAMSYGTKYKFKIEDPTRDGYKFLGWSETKNCETADYKNLDTEKEKGANGWAGVFAEDIGGHSNADVTLYPVWKPNTFTLKTKDGNTDLYCINENNSVYTSYPMEYGTEYTFKIDKPKKDGYTFLGWSKTQNATIPDANVNYSDL